MKRVLFVTDNLFPLGPARALISAALSLVSQGIEVHLAARSSSHDDKWLDGLPITLHRLSIDSKAANEDGFWLNRRNLKTISEFRQLLSDLRPSAIHAGGGIAAAWTQVAVLNLLGSSKFGKPRPELVYHEFRIPQRPWRAFQWFSNRAGSSFSRAIVPHFVIQQALSNSQFPGTIELAPVGLKQLQQIPHFSTSDPSAGRQRLREHLGLSLSSKIAGTVAPLIPRSRIKDLIWATDLFSVVRDDFHFVIFGTGPQAERLKRFANFTEATDRVHFVGEPKDAWAMFQGLDVYWHSHLAEPWPVNVLMAMAQGIPVVSVLGEGTSELILHQQTGLGVNFGARDEFARWTKYLFEQTESANQISEQGRQYVRSKFSL